MAEAGGYEVALGRGLLGRLGEVAAVAPHLKGRRVFVVSDRTVHALYGDRFERGLRGAGAEMAGRTLLEPGEAHKTVASLSSLWDALVASELERKDCLVVLGGGVVGDVAGFAAATYRRGIDFLQFPTTLLAMADSSVGGKTGVDHPRGKNLLGAFHRPRGVVADLEVLETLPGREVLSGLAEVLKAGLVGDPGLFALLEARGPEVANDAAALEEALARAVGVKARFVIADERETGARALLNFGHTLGHAVEVAGGYGSITHGDAVALGMGAAVRLSVILGLLPDITANRVLAVLSAWGYPQTLQGVAVDRVWQALRQDKKSVDGLPRWVLLRAVGEAEWGHEIAPDVLEPLFRELREDT